MESPLSTTTSTLYNLSKTLTSSSSSTKPLTSNINRHIARSLLQPCLHNRFISTKINCIHNKAFQSLTSSSSSSSLAISLRNLYLVSPITSRLACISSSATPFAHGGGNDGFNGGNGGGGGDGDGGSSGGEIKSKSVASDSEELSALSPDVIILDVGGMMCGGCAASVKRILESQPTVSSASVNLATETAIVWPVSEAKSMQNWQQQLGETLAKHLSNSGFTSNPRGEGAIGGNIA